MKIADSEFPPSNMSKLESLMSGVEKSLLRKRKSRMTLVMAGNRRKYEPSVRLIRQWRRNRTSNETLSLISHFSKNDSIELTLTLYNKMRNYFICEIIIYNGQRAGIVSGINIGEVEDAKVVITSDGHHKIIVSRHKTGIIHSATIFIYENVFLALLTFIDYVLPKLPTYSSNIKFIDDSSCIFQTFTGENISSSSVTPYLDKAF